MIDDEIYIDKQKAEELLKNGEFRAAYELLSSVLEKLSNFAAQMAFETAWLGETKPSEQPEGRDHILRRSELYRTCGELATLPSLKANGYFRAGWQLQSLNYTEKAEPLYEEALICARQDDRASIVRAHAAYWLGVIRESSEEYLAAINLYEESIQFDPSVEVEALFRIFICFGKIYDFDNVERTFIALQKISVPEEKKSRKKELIELALPQYRIFNSAREG